MELATVVRALGDAGYLRLMFGEHPRLTHATLLSEEAAYLNYAFESTIATALSCAYPLHRHGVPAVRDRLLPGILDGRQVGAICVTEPGAGSDTSAIRTRVELDPARDEWVVTGTKRYISNASVADLYIVYGVSDPDAPAGRGVSAVVVPAGTEGLSFPRRYTFMGRRGCVGGRGALRRVPGAGRPSARPPARRHGRDARHVQLRAHRARGRRARGRPQRVRARARARPDARGVRLQSSAPSSSSGAGSPT